MIRTRAVCIWVAMFMVVSPANAQDTPNDDAPAKVSLKRGETRDDSELPYRQASLTVQYDSPADGNSRHKVIRGITIRSARGGPTMLFRVTIAPGSPARDISVILPVLSLEESYKVRLLSQWSDRGDVIGEFDLSLDWPAGWVTSDAFLDPEAYDDGEYLPPVWSNRTLRNVFVVAVISCVVLGAMLLVRSAVWTAVGATVTVIAAAAGLWFTASFEPIIVRRQVGDDGEHLLVSCLREARCEILPPHTVPLYHNMDEMSRDEAVIYTEGKLTVDLKCGNPVLFGRPPAARVPATQNHQGDTMTSEP
ncbi:MAG: hypothetical protein GY794_05670 [bacterium]|nr:hypothetical protein [bacterium]